jgi:hypothetical protein
MAQRPKKEKILPKSKSEELMASLHKDLLMFAIELEGLTAIWLKEPRPTKLAR